MRMVRSRFSRFCERAYKMTINIITHVFLYAFRWKIKFSDLKVKNKYAESDVILKCSKFNHWLMYCTVVYHRTISLRMSKDNI
jgi:hypothetical protein